jgi:O-acetyl-ADP-ribose deacetylase (regulator of RNase III)
MATTQIHNTRLELVRGDITETDADAFVYDITEDGKLGSGLGAAIQMRGGVVIQKALDAVAPIATGQAVSTEAGILKASWIIHVNGPKFREEDEEGKLRAVTRAALAEAERREATRLAVPPIGTGLYQVPLELCARVMVEEIAAHLRNGTSLAEVTIVVPDQREFGPFDQAIKNEVHDA